MSFRFWGSSEIPKFNSLHRIIVCLLESTKKITVVHARIYVENPNRTKLYYGFSIVFTSQVGVVERSIEDIHAKDTRDSAHSDIALDLSFAEFYRLLNSITHKL